MLDYFVNVQKAVAYESEFVDLSVKAGGETIFYEIKMATTAKICIRQALGQLLEYAHYPEAAKAQKLVVVGDAPPTEADKIYLANLRKRYGLPLYYSRFDWATNILEPEV